LPDFRLAGARASRGAAGAGGDFSLRCSLSVAQDDAVAASRLLSGGANCCDSGFRGRRGGCARLGGGSGAAAHGDQRDCYFNGNRGDFGLVDYDWLAGRRCDYGRYDNGIRHAADRSRRPLAYPFAVPTGSVTASTVTLTAGFEAIHAFATQVRPVVTTLAAEGAGSAGLVGLGGLGGAPLLLPPPPPEVPGVPPELSPPPPPPVST
jgi:hypothetical protein